MEKNITIKVNNNLCTLNTVETFVFRCPKKKRDIDKCLGVITDTLDKKYVECNPQYDTEMKCFLDDDNYLRNLAKQQPVDQVITLYNDVFNREEYLLVKEYFISVNGVVMCAMILKQFTNTPSTTITID